MNNSLAKRFERASRRAFNADNLVAMGPPEQLEEAKRLSAEAHAELDKLRAAIENQRAREARPTKHITPRLKVRVTSKQREAWERLANGTPLSVWLAELADAEVARVASAGQPSGRRRKVIPE